MDAYQFSHSTVTIQFFHSRLCHCTKVEMFRCLAIYDHMWYRYRGKKQTIQSHPTIQTTSVIHSKRIHLQSPRCEVVQRHSIHIKPPTPTNGRFHFHLILGRNDCNVAHRYCFEPIGSGDFDYIVQALQFHIMDFALRRLKESEKGNKPILRNLWKWVKGCLTIRSTVGTSSSIVIFSPRSMIEPS